MTSAKRSPASPASSSNDSTESVVLNKDGSRRKSRLLSRKTDHSVIERRRRDKMNEKLIMLQNVVPACRAECQHIIDKKFQSTSELSGRRLTERERKARDTFVQRQETTVVLEKLCIMSHTLDYVQQLERNIAELTKRHRTISELERPTVCCQKPHKKRRLHWGSNDIRQASVNAYVQEQDDALAHLQASDSSDTGEDSDACKRCIKDRPSVRDADATRCTLPPTEACTPLHHYYSCAKHSWCRASRFEFNDEDNGRCELPRSTDTAASGTCHLPPSKDLSFTYTRRLASIYGRHTNRLNHEGLAPLSLYTSRAPVRT